MNKIRNCFLCCCLLVPLAILGDLKPDLVKFKNRLLKERRTITKPQITLTGDDLKKIAGTLRTQRAGLVMVSTDAGFHDSRPSSYKLYSYKGRSKKLRAAPRWKLGRYSQAIQDRRIQARIKEIKKRIAILEDKLECEAYMEQMVFQRRSNRGPGDDYDYVIYPEMDARRVRYISPDILRKKWLTEIRMLKAILQNLR